MNGRVPLFIEFLLSLEHAPGILRGGARIEVDQRFAVDFLPKNGEVVADATDFIVIECGNLGISPRGGGNHCQNRCSLSGLRGNRQRRTARTGGVTL
ncbi:hypothetical protein AHiyo1_12970 [Arthrobacter sp. Hiyo1]|nr:hypothetical protein AHiyo1_12970 [Arthrobacter sp. Hiyo1]